MGSCQRNYFLCPGNHHHHHFYVQISALEHELAEQPDPNLNFASFWVWKEEYLQETCEQQPKKLLSPDPHPVLTNPKSRETTPVNALFYKSLITQGFIE